MGSLLLYVEQTRSDFTGARFGVIILPRLGAIIFTGLSVTTLTNHRSLFKLSYTPLDPYGHSIPNVLYFVRRLKSFSDPDTYFNISFQCLQLLMDTVPLVLNSPGMQAQKTSPAESSLLLLHKEDAP